MPEEQTEQPKDWITLAVERQAIPKPLRKETVEEFCLQMGIPTSTFYWTMHKPENQKRVLEIVLNKAKDSAPEILEKLVEKAKMGEDRALELYLDNIMKLAKNIDVKSDGQALPVLVKFMDCGTKTEDNRNTNGV